MTGSDQFSERHGFSAINASEIKIRNDAPDELRYVIKEIAIECTLSPSPLRNIICSLLRKRPDSNNWSEYPNINSEVADLLDSCEWFEVYDIIEELYKNLTICFDFQTHEPQSECFAQKINQYFIKVGIGWQLLNGKIEYRGPESFETTVRDSIKSLSSTGRQTASNELHQALLDLSQRPNPDVTGAIQHGMAALECVARDIVGDQKVTLGTILKHHPNLIPKPLDVAVEKAWGYASEMGRHLQEGREPKLEEAELVVGIAGTISTYLNKKSPSKLPF